MDELAALAQHAAPIAVWRVWIRRAILDARVECVGVDENCFAQLVTRSTHTDKKDAILIGILLSDADLAPELVYAAEDFAMGVKSLLKVIGNTSKDSKPMSRVLYN